MPQPLPFQIRNISPFPAESRHFCVEVMQISTPVVYLYFHAAQQRQRPCANHFGVLLHYSRYLFGRVHDSRGSFVMGSVMRSYLPVASALSTISGSWAFLLRRGGSAGTRSIRPSCISVPAPLRTQPPFDGTGRTAPSIGRFPMWWAGSCCLCTSTGAFRLCFSACRSIFCPVAYHGGGHFLKNVFPYLHRPGYEESLVHIHSSAL